MWKARTYHAPRYIAFITIIATVGGFAFYSYTGSIKKVSAAASATYSGGNPYNSADQDTLTVDGGGKYMLTRDTNCGTGASLWPLNLASANAITNQTINNGSNYRGKLCIDNNDSVIVQGNDTSLAMVGDITLSRVQAITG